MSSPGSSSWRTRAALTLAPLCLLLAACDTVSSAKIAAWQAAPDGADHLAKAMRRTNVVIGLRAEAGGALVAIGRVEMLEGALAALTIEDRAALGPPLVRRIAGALDVPDRPRAASAREALYTLRRQATTDETRAAIDAALFPAFARDLRAGQVEGGRLPLREMLTELGAAAVPTLQAVLADDAAPFALAAELLGTVGSRAARETGGAALTGRARAGLGDRGGPELWQAFGRLGGKDVIAYLGERIEQGPPDQQDHAAKAMLELPRDEALVAFALRRVAAPGVRDSVRDAMFELLDRQGGDAATDGLLSLIATPIDTALRYRAYKAALRIGGGKALVRALEAFPTSVAHQPADVGAHLAAPIIEIGWGHREPLFQAIESKLPLARMAVLYVMEQSGHESDAQFAIKLAKDTGRVPGFPPNKTVGKEAARITALLAAKKSETPATGGR